MHGQINASKSGEASVVVLHEYEEPRIQPIVDRRLGHCLLGEVR